MTLRGKEEEINMIKFLRFRKEDPRTSKLTFMALKNIAKLLGNESFHRAMLACATEVVLVANGQLSYLFPRSALAFGVTPFQLFKALGMFVRINGKSLPERLKLHLMWCDEQLVVVHAWIAKWGGVSVPEGDGIFTLMYDHKSALHGVRMRSMRGSKTNQAKQIFQAGCTKHASQDGGGVDACEYVVNGRKVVC